MALGTVTLSCVLAGWAGALPSLAALVVFVPMGAVVWEVGAVMALGNVIGGYLGARTAVARGGGFVRVVFIVVVGAFLLRLGWDLLTPAATGITSGTHLLPPGARLVGDWLAAVETHINAPTGAAGAARFRMARDPGQSFWARLFARRGLTGPFARGFLISKAQAQALSRPGMTLDALPRGVAVRTLRAGLLPPASR